LSLISRHLDPARVVEFNTPYSQERRYPESGPDDDLSTSLRGLKGEAAEAEIPEESIENMASTQAPHPTVLIPGPVEFDDAVLQAMSHPRYVPFSG
jgi:alanine-glyoxylate transaminase / serine-glyoxylate transaminase / serine-pyruvate transaminase